MLHYTWFIHLHWG